MSFFDNLEAEFTDTNIISDSLSEYLYFDIQSIYEIFIKNSQETIDINTLTINTPCKLFNFDILDYAVIIMQIDNKLNRDTDIIDMFEYEQMFKSDIDYFIKLYLKSSKQQF